MSQPQPIMTVGCPTGLSQEGIGKNSGGAEYSDTWLVSLALWKWRQEDVLMFKAILTYTINLTLVWVI